MKYINFKRYKFSKILKKIDPRSYDFFSIYKYIDIKRYKSIFIEIFNFTSLFVKYIFSKAYKHLNNIRKYNIPRIYKNIDIKKYNISKIYRNIDLSKYSISKIYRNIDLSKYNHILLYAGGFVLFSIFIYLNIPAFFNYDKSKIENLLCGDYNLTCSIEGKIKYSSFPNPRIEINDFIIKDPTDKKKTLANAKNKKRPNHHDR